MSDRQAVVAAFPCAAVVEGYRRDWSRCEVNEAMYLFVELADEGDAASIE